MSLSAEFDPTPGPYGDTDSHVDIEMHLFKNVGSLCKSYFTTCLSSLDLLMSFQEADLHSRFLQ